MKKKICIHIYRIIKSVSISLQQMATFQVVGGEKAPPGGYDVKCL